MSDHQEKISRVDSEKDQLASKHESLKKTSKQKEATLQERVNELEKDKLSLTDRSYQLE